MKRSERNSYKNRQVFDEVDLGGFEASPGPPSGHVHDAIEISVFEHGSVTMLYGGTPVTIPPNRLVVHWGMLPHQVLKRSSGALVVGLHLPLAWVMQWGLPSSLLTRLLDLEYIIEPPREHPSSDLELLHDWNKILNNGEDLSQEIILAEVRARLLRLSLSQVKTRQKLSDTPAPHIFVKALKYIVRHFKEPIHLDQIAYAAGVSSRHLTRLFHQNTEQTINAYITRLRLSHVMRLLVTTDRTVTDIMYDAGFSCTTHFYKVFREQTGKTPRQYRQE